LEKLWSLGISELHSKKHAKFAAMFSSYTQRHYERFIFGSKVLETLHSPLTTREIATMVGRSESRVIQMLTKLGRDKKVEKFKVRSSCFWIRSDPLP